MNFKGIRADSKTEKGEQLFSGQIVKVRGKINPLQEKEVFFEPNYGFRVQGNNLSDAYIIEVVKDVSFVDKFFGTLTFFIYSIFGFFR